MDEDGYLGRAPSYRLSKVLYFHEGLIAMMNREKANNALFACPCCGYATLVEVAEYEICEICFWEDDGEDDYHAIERSFFGGPNGVSLKEARFNFIVFGSAEKKDLEHCRKPNETDINLRNYKLNYEVVSSNEI